MLRTKLDVYVNLGAILILNENQSNTWNTSVEMFVRKLYKFYIIIIILHFYIIYIVLLYVTESV